jgi:paired amphipathic helix protein Sin3a
LNDYWFSHPTWASEESGFNSHKKNSFEEALHKSEEERHEFHVTLEALARTLAHFEPLAARLDMMETAEERAAFRLGPDLGSGADGGVKIFERIIRKIYGRDGGNEVVQALRESPSVAVPVVLARLRQKDEEWRAAHREWSRTWREVDAKNFYKSLDSQGIGFKANDKKATTSKSFVMEIEAVKAAQEKERHEKARYRLKKRGVGSGRRGGGVGLMGSTGPQLEYMFEDTHVMQDSLKMIYSFLDHSAAQYSGEERRAVERFLRAFVPVLCMYPVHEFDAACGSLEEVAAVVSSMVDDGVGEAIVNGIDHPDARRPSPINMNGNLHSLNPHDDDDGDGEDDDDEEPITFKPKTEDSWIRELTSPAPDGDPKSSQSPGPSSVRRPFFANTTFYTLMRLLQVRYMFPFFPLSLIDKS